ncbi:MAG: 50S ribosomal protein L29 [bacterium]|nr:50S ribosomal protein L29 [bacterium]
MKPSELRQMNPEEVHQLLNDKLEELSNLRLRNVTMQLDNPLTIRHARRDLARIRTVLKEHELGLHALSGVSSGRTEEEKGN